MSDPVGAAAAAPDGAASGTPRRGGAARLLLDVPLSLLSGLLMASAQPLVLPFLSAEEILPAGTLEPLAFFAFLPLLSRLRTAWPRRAFLLGVLSGAAYFLLSLYWLDVAMTTFGRMPRYLSFPVLFLLVGFLSLFWGTALWAALRIRDKLSLPLAFVLPAVWVALEFLRNYALTGFPWANLGYTQVRTLWLAQLASIGGVNLVAFVVLLVNGVLEAVLASRIHKTPLPRRSVGVLAVLLTLAGVYGAIRLGPAVDPREARRVPAAVVQGNLDEKVRIRGPAGQAWVLQRMLAQSREAVKEGASLVVWPEGTLPEAVPPDSQSLGAIQGALFRMNAELIVGGVTEGLREGKRLLTNSAFLTDGSLNVLARYDKGHLVPFGEYVPLETILPYRWFVPESVGFFTPGVDHRPLDGQAGKLGVLICYEAIFPEIARETVAEGAQLLVNITNDSWYGFTSAPYQHLAMARMRAIETGRYLVRAANCGVSAVIDPVGRELGRLPLGLVPTDRDDAALEQLRPPERLVRTVALLERRTVYGVIGDLFSWLCCGAAMGLLGASFVWRRLFPGKTR